MRLSKIVLAATTLFCSNTLQAEIPLKIVRGEQDTVYSERHYIVGVTQAENQVYVNNESVKVYKTGAFGSELKLLPGNNSVKIEVSDGNEKQEKIFNIFYESQKPATKVTLQEAREALKKNTLKEKSFYAVSQEGAYLQYSDGNDRLGGSKMGYIDAGIVLKVIGEIGNLYKVQLSQTRYAFIPQEYLQATEEESGNVNTGSWRITNMGQYDRVSISLPQRLPYYSWTQLDPTTICVELYGAMNNSNWITQMENLKMIDYVDYRQVESDVFQIIIKLQKKYAWGYDVYYKGNNLTIDVKHTPTLTMKGLKIGLDAGHGGSSSGAVSPTGITEKEVNLQLVNEIKELLESKGGIVTLSRDADYALSMTERKKIFKDAGIDLMLSIHNNAGGSPLVPMGTSTYYKHIVNRDLAACILNRMLELGIPNYGLTGNFNFSLNQPTEYPNALLEILFMSSLIDEELLSDATFCSKIAKQVVLGLEDYLKKAKTE